MKHPVSVITDLQIIQRFFQNKVVSTQLIFCAYQSSAGLPEAVQDNHSIFELIISDAAHSTAGSENKTFSIGLDNVLIPAKKRLFVPAAPRHYSLQHS